uniref:Lipoprotein n=1 Tax=uncultured Thiotrichaceae bacterium TaxID=298394 RepID=A0A6S6U163_9GAMM|nr:MAG: Unknown protein [uncultured Thiotrichaceae bacterium]
MSLKQVKTLSLGIKIVSLAAALTFFSGCTVSLMSQYDEKTDERIELFGESANDLLFQLEELNAQKPECSYKNHTDSYRSLKVQLQTIQMHEQAKPKNTHTQKQVEALQNRVDQLITIHKKKCLPAAFISITQSQINDMLGHILKLERSKRDPE